ncbi:MAG: divalent-cation tolerance protein CutA [Planctomycetota bacterium]
MAEPGTDDIRFLYVTFPAAFDVPGLGGKAIGQQLCACVNVWTGRSVYHWEGALQNDEEQFALFKTTATREPALREFIAANHPYSVPCIAALAPALNAPFAAYVHDQTGGRG